ncbi:NADPH:quinone oxidoreductase family protein [Nocardioides campestrisoli]|uniref:NADPH:quinone oxidoreductase family protein n=1 Tax=Nocardioides campestrisoli TaxID=2736757 RepID=UPI00163DDB87|nr:NADPH:quinone oxidoreductase family protein [Nocardioides campestrisoli]
MRAWQVQELGEPDEVMRLVALPDPEPGDGQVLVRVEAAALNFPDLLLSQGKYQERPELPFTPGLEAAGTVVTGPRAGEQVVVAPRLPHGTLAELVVVPEADVLPVPQGMPLPKAAAMVTTYHTGWSGLHRRAALQEGEALLVHAGAGGVGSAAIQLGKAAGATVVATAGGPEKVEVCRRLGADVVVDYLTEDFVEVVKEATDGRGADVIYDSVGGDVFDRSRKCIAFEGRLLVIGFASGRIPEVGVNHPLIKNYSIVGLHHGLYRKHDPSFAHRIQANLARLWRDGLIDPLIGAEVRMEDAASALVRLGDRGTVGKIVVQVHA